MKSSEKQGKGQDVTSDRCGFKFCFAVQLIELNQSTVKGDPIPHHRGRQGVMNKGDNVRRATSTLVGVRDTLAY